MRKADGKKSRAQIVLICVCVALLIVCGYYMIHWNIVRIRILRGNAAYSALYVPEPTDAAATAPSLMPTAALTGIAAEAATDAPTLVPTGEPVLTLTNVPTSVPTSVPTNVPTDIPTAIQTEVPTSLPTETPTLAPTAAPTDTPAPTNTPAPTEILFEAPVDEAIALDATLAPGMTNAPIRPPLPTPDADTIIFALETPPPVQESFAELLALNPETAGFLTIGDWMSLPVVQRFNDNEYYLNHDFENNESIGGTLFLDGSNLLVPEDDCLIVYGHNMKNGTMLAKLSNYTKADFFRENCIVRFDTIYENRCYVPFAVFSVSADPESRGFLNFRRFDFDGDDLEQFAQTMQKRSELDVPIDVSGSDRLLLLVTCEYTHNNGRLILALREMRAGETEDEIAEVLREIKVK